MASVISEVLVHLHPVTQPLRMQAFQHQPIWADRFMHRTDFLQRMRDPHNILHRRYAFTSDAVYRIMAERMSIMCGHEPSDPCEQQIYSYGTSNRRWCMIWASVHGRIDAFMRSINSLSAIEQQKRMTTWIQAESLAKDSIPPACRDAVIAYAGSGRKGKSMIGMIEKRASSIRHVPFPWQTLTFPEVIPPFKTHHATSKPGA
jgi:hypothetical protein